MFGAPGVYPGNSSKGTKRTTGDGCMKKGPQSLQACFIISG
jgi:hypothetical protein